MRFTSWDRSQADAPRLLVDDGPEEIGTFRAQEATVEGRSWGLSVDASNGARVCVDDGREFVLRGKLKRDEELDADVAGRHFRFLAEGSKNWIVEDDQAQKVAQFSAANHGVRRSILEFSEDATVSREEAAALSYFARLLLEAKLASFGFALVVTLLILSIVAVIVLFT